MRQLFVVLAAAIVFTPRPVFSETGAAARPPDLPPQTDFLPVSEGIPAPSMAPAPKPLLMLGLLAAVAQWRLPAGGTTSPVTANAPLASASQGYSPSLHGKGQALSALPQFIGCSAAVVQPHRRAPPYSL
jgi:hypothetical protein